MMEANEIYSHFSGDHKIKILSKDLGSLWTVKVLSGRLEGVEAVLTAQTINTVYKKEAA